LEKILDRATSTCITFAGPEAPALGNWTPQALIDEAASLGEAKRRIEGAEKTIKEVLKTHVTPRLEEYRGELFKLSYTNQERNALDQTKAKAKLLELGGQAALDECMANTEVPTMRFKSLG
jgi:hypothetical protein